MPSKRCITRSFKNLLTNSAPETLTDTLLQDLSPHRLHEKFLIVYLPVAPDGVLSYRKKHLPENAASEKYAKQMPGGFTHFYCHRVVLSTHKILVFSTIADGSVKSNR